MAEANVLYKEGTGYPTLTPFSIDYTFYRNLNNANGAPLDTDNNATDFLFADTQGTPSGPPQRLGAPGPENLSSPTQRNATIKSSLIDPGCSGSGPVDGLGHPTTVNACARQRDTTAGAGSTSTFGTLSIRRKFTNTTGLSVTRLRFRIVDVTTFPPPAGTADLRPITSSDYVANLSGGGTTTVMGVTLETPPSQPNGGGFNSSLSAGIITMGTPLANGVSINLHFLVGVQQTGNYRFFVNVEALTNPPSRP
ncbi:MAG TPA: hypothetical protein VE821_12535, partial [Pyrinomonadaceae bacterium]|nr:hypothetical protein [Pyrinomonadaceae bacterium]